MYKHCSIYECLREYCSTFQGYMCKMPYHHHAIYWYWSFDAKEVLKNLKIRCQFSIVRDSQG